MKKIIITIAVLAGMTATAQVKIGSNPTVLSNATSNFEIEGTTTANQFVVLKNGNVGIGTINPLRTLHIVSTSVGAISNLIFENTDTTDGNGTVIGLRTTTTGAGGGSMTEMSGFQLKSIIHDHATRKGEVSIFTNTAGVFNFFNFNANGNFGLGTMTPTAKLHVVGEFLLDNATKGAGKVLTSDASGNATWQTASVSTLNVDNVTAPVAAPVQQAVTAGSIQFVTTNTGVIMKSADGTNYMLTIENGGVLTVKKVTP